MTEFACARDALGQDLALSDAALGEPSASEMPANICLSVAARLTMADEYESRAARDVQ
jgi:hypothetical protein